MCLLALFFQVVDDAPVVVGANREEYYQRDGEPPRLLEGSVRAVAGVDPVAGGTWLGVNEYGVLAAVTIACVRRRTARGADIGQGSSTSRFNRFVTAASASAGPRMETTTALALMPPARKVRRGAESGAP